MPLTFPGIEPTPAGVYVTVCATEPMWSYIHTQYEQYIYNFFVHAGDTYTYNRIYTDTCNTYTYLQIHTHTYTWQSVPGGSFQALLQPIENPLGCTGYRDHLRRGLRQDCQARKAYEMPMGGAKGALWTPQRRAYAHLE